MKKKLCYFFISSAMLLSGCVNEKWKENFPIAIVEPVSFENQLNIAKYTAVLRNKDLEKSVRIKTLYARGELYSYLGLEALAFTDFSLILRIDPTIAEVYNYLGFYLAASDDFEAAYQSFDSAIELDPNYFYAYLNRGITSYNGERYLLAEDDIGIFYDNNPNNPVGLLWMYLVEEPLLGKRQAKANLQKRYDTLEDKQIWGCSIIEFYLGIIGESTLLNSVKQLQNNVGETVYAEYLSEVYFYLGKYYLNNGDKESALTLFKLTLATNVKHFIEYHQARFELNKIRSDIANQSK